MRGIEELLDAQEEEVAHDPGERNFRCVDCNACYDCRFCERCDACSECTYCEDSVECTGCTQCRRCLSCEGSSYCEDSRECTGSRYLTLCVDCADCVHCLGCVGLSGAEFHVLNRKVPRREYFDLVKQVQAELAARAERGWRPEVIGLEPVEDEVTAPWAGPDADEGSAWLDDDAPGRPPAPTRAAERPRWEEPEDEPEAESPWRSDSSSPRAGPPAAVRRSPSAQLEPDKATPREGLRRGRRPPRRS